MHELTDEYWRTTLNINRVLLPYFNREGEVDRFLNLMDEMGSVISGSTALQFFSRRIFHQSDLDVYVPSINLSKACRWLSDDGYEQREKKEENEDAGLDDVYPTIKEIEKVETFVSSTTGKVIQLIGTKHSPLSAILDFHSSEFCNCHM